MYGTNILALGMVAQQRSAAFFPVLFKSSCSFGLAGSEAWGVGASRRPSCADAAPPSGCLERMNLFAGTGAKSLETRNV